MKIYTKTGDNGTTGLLGGERLPKHAARIAAYGDVDELNAVLGVIRAQTPHAPLRDPLGQIQNALFTVGAQLASPKRESRIEIITSAQVDFLERQIDVMSEQLPELRSFILPGGSATSAYLHLARTVCRRAERSIVALASAERESVDSWLLIYINRLSDFLFMLARLANQIEDVEDVPWKPRSRG